MKKLIPVVPLLVALFPLIGCVSQSSYDKLSGEYTTLEQKSQAQNETIKAKEDELFDLKHRLAEQTSLIDGLKSRVGKSALHKQELDRSLAETRTALLELAKRKEEVENELKQFRQLTAGLQTMINTGNVKVTFIKGRMVVSLGSDVLFKTGSARLSTDGMEAVSEVAKALSQIPDKDFQIEGHTDNLPIKTKEFPSNWQLAAARAYSVLTTMQAAGLPVERVSMASYADTRPAADNDSADNRALNRRIDIAVLPDLSKLMDVEAVALRAKSQTRVPASAVIPPAPEAPAEEE